MDDAAPAWKIFERLVACFALESASMDVSVTPNATIQGSLSGVPRQIDVLLDARFEEDIARRVIFDAKLRSRKLDVKDVEAFEGMMRDVRASRGVLVCTNGWTEAAERRAMEIIDIQLLSEDDALEYDYGFVDPCPYCADRKLKQPGMVFWDGQFPLPFCPGWAIVFTGKCDTCRSFAFWCWECGDKKVVPDGVVHECGCEWKWFTEADDDGISFIVRMEEGEVPLDRRLKA